NGHKSPIVKEPPILREHKPSKGRTRVHDLPSARSPVRPVPGFRASGLVTTVMSAIPCPLKSPIWGVSGNQGTNTATLGQGGVWRSEEHTSELQSRFDLVCRLLL